MIGQIVGPYRILEQLGQGGMGIVYKAQDERLGRTVALKFLPPQLSADARARERFVQEARAASALDHANICAIYDIGQTDDGRVYIVMAFYDGQTLKYRMDDGPIPVEETIEIVRQISRGLARAHEAGIVHRDIKPANIMVTDRGEVKILDFGLAKLASSSDLTKEGSTIGTAAYMSPEQSRGEAVDARSDLWSLGVVTYEMFTGKRPFGGGYDAAMLYAILNEEAAPIDQFNPAVPGGVARAVERCLRKDAAGRFSSVADFVRTFESAAGLSSGSRADSATASAPAPASPASFTKVTAGFAMSALVTLGVLYAAMHFFGLPDWVFATGVALMALGLPILLLAGRMEQSRASMDSGEQRSLSGLPAWLSVRRAAWGGVAAMAALILATTVWMGMRALGIGPAGTLVSTGALSERDFVVVADFENRTQDPNLGRSVTEAFRIDLSQSETVNLVDGATVRDALVRMQRDPDTPLTADLAREIALRTGAKAMILGDVSSVGRSFVLAARLVSAEDGSELVALRENADDDGAILEAIDRLSGELRERIGESLVSIRGGQPLENVTTTSLEALRLYSEAETISQSGDYEGSEGRLVRALEIDSTFAMGWRKLAVVRSNAGRPLALQLEASRNAYRLRDRLPDRERLLTEAYYYSRVVPDEDREIAAYEAVLARWPDDVRALNNLAIVYNGKERPAEAEALARRALAAGEGITFHQNLIESLALQKKWDEVEAELDSQIARYPTDATAWIWKALLKFNRGEAAAVSVLLDSAATRTKDAADRMLVENTRSTIANAAGRYAEAERRSRETTAEAVSAGFTGAALANPLRWAATRDFLDPDPAGLRRRIDELVREHPLGIIDVRSRPDPFVATLYAWTGDATRAQQVLDAWREAVPAELRPDEPYWVMAAIALASGNRAEAIRLLDEQRRVDECTECWWEVQARMYDRMDSTDAAIRSYERILADDRGFGITEEAAPIRLRLGDLYDRSGNLDKAIENYSRFVELWKNADPDLQRHVSFARQEIDRLLSLKAREPGTTSLPSGQ